MEYVETLILTAVAQLLSTSQITINFNDYRLYSFTFTILRLYWYVDPF